MKNLFAALVCATFLISCSSENKDNTSDSETTTETETTTTDTEATTTTTETPEGDSQELYTITDGFVAAMDPAHENHGNTGNKHTKTTESGYSVTVYGKLVNVKIQDGGSDDQYEALKEELADYYSDNENVKEVKINAGGTVIIDCSK